jgi:hypothetical protein
MRHARPPKADNRISSGGFTTGFYCLSVLSSTRRLRRVHLVRVTKWRRDAITILPGRDWISQAYFFCPAAFWIRSKTVSGCETIEAWLESLTVVTVAFMRVAKVC